MGTTVPFAPEATTELGIAPMGAPLPKLKPGPGRSQAEVADHQRVRIQRATIEIVMERGYSSLTVREITHLAGVSTKAHYQLYASKELAFEHTHELVVQRLLGSIAEARVLASGRRDDVRRIFAALLDEMARDPRAARFALVEACEAGRDALERMHRIDRSLGAAIAECLGRVPGGSSVSPRLIGAMVAGTMSVVRSRLRAGSGEELSVLGDPLAQWALSYVDPISAELEDLNQAMTSLGLREDFPHVVPPSGMEGQGDEVEEPSGDLALLLSATARLVAGEGYDELSVRKVLAAAGIPRRGFYANFSRIEDCFVAALELQMKRGVARVRDASKTSGLSASAACGAISALSDRVARDSVFANLCFGEFATPAERIADCREHFMLELGRVILGDMNSAAEPLAFEASMGALWGTLHNEVIMGRAHRAPRLNATLAYLALAPTIGASVAVNAVHRQSTPEEDRGHLAPNGF